MEEKSLVLNRAGIFLGVTGSMYLEETLARALTMLLRISLTTSYPFSTPLTSSPLTAIGRDTTRTIFWDASTALASLSMNVDIAEAYPFRPWSADT